jgi:hypothetical protein
MPSNPDAETAPLRENRLSRHFRAFPARRPALRLAWSRRGGLRTPANEASLGARDRPARPPGVRLHPMTVLCLGLRTALQCGRGDRAPPRRLPRRHLRPFPARPSMLGLPPAEGRAPHARNDGIGLTKAFLLRQPSLRLLLCGKETLGNANGLNFLLQQPLQQIEPPQCLRDIGILDGDLSQCLQNRLPPPRFLHLL